MKRSIVVVGVGYRGLLTERGYIEEIGVSLRRTQCCIHSILQVPGCGIQTCSLYSCIQSRFQRVLFVHWVLLIWMEVGYGLDMKVSRLMLLCCGARACFTPA